MGALAGMVVNSGLVNYSHRIIPLPDGVDPGDMDSLMAAMPDFEPKHFIIPFLAHALGTLIGAFVTAKIAETNHKKLALIIGGFFLLGGITAAYMLPAPLSFEIFDLIFAYIPMAWLGWKLAGGVE
jgi:hypothetical protein